MKKKFTRQFRAGLKWLVILSATFQFTCATAQQNIDSLEYGIDNIAGFGQANKIPITPAPVVNNFSFNVNLTAISNGFHTLFLRTHSITTPANQGYWSETNYTWFYKQNPASSPVNIQKLEYFIDTDPGEGLATLLAVTPAPDISGISFSPNIGSLSNGFHVLFIRSLDANGIWSISNYQYFYKQNNVVAPLANINKIEYFIDTDPGEGNGNTLSFSPASNIAALNFNADISSTSPGFHALFVRSLDANGKWNITNYIYFYKGGPGAGSPPNIIKIEYFIDTDPGYYSATDIPITPAPDIANKNFSANTTGLSIGLHYLNIRSLDANLKWSLDATDTFRVLSALPLRLIGFSAVPQGSAVNVSWQTSFEQNLHSFDIEYSIDGIVFTKIGSVSPANNLSGSSYNYRHLTPAQGKNFYRLKIVEDDGSIHYSDIRLVNFNGEQSFVKLYPNPADKHFTVRTDWINFTLEIIAADGKIIKEIKNTNANTVIDISQLPSGLYTIRVSKDKNIENSFLIIKH
jgi:hypothetical protein